MTIGKRIKERRTELGWSQRDLSSKMGYSNHSTITKIEAGKVDIPQSKVVQFAQVLNTTVAYLMNWEEVQKNNDILSDIVVKLRTDEDFSILVEQISKFDEKQMERLRTYAAFLKDFQD